MMLGTMTEPKKPSRQGGKKPASPPADPPPVEPVAPARSGTPLNVWIDDDIYRAFENFRTSQLAKPTKTSVVEAALIDFLRKHGHYPPAAKPADE